MIKLIHGKLLDLLTYDRSSIHQHFYGPTSSKIFFFTVSVLTFLYLNSIDLFTIMNSLLFGFWTSIFYNLLIISDSLYITLLSNYIKKYGIEEVEAITKSWNKFYKVNNTYIKVANFDHSYKNEQFVSIGDELRITNKGTELYCAGDTRMTYVTSEKHKDNIVNAILSKQ